MCRHRNNNFIKLIFFDNHVDWKPSGYQTAQEYIISCDKTGYFEILVTNKN